MRRLVRYLVLMSLIMIVLVAPIMGRDTPIRVFVNGKYMWMETEPVVDNNRILVPIGFISETLGFDVDYLELARTVVIKNDAKYIEIVVGSNKAKVDGKQVTLDVKPLIQEDRIFVPLRFISEALGQQVVWDKNNKIVLVGQYEKEAKIENTFLYTNEKYGYTLNFPNSWKEEAIIETKDGILYVYDKKSAERFIQDGFDDFGPVFEIRVSDYPTVINDVDYVLHYLDDHYIETVFGMDFQFYPETLESYAKIFDEGQEVLGSFQKINNDSIVLVQDKDGYAKEIQVLEDIIDKYVLVGIFRKEEIFTYRTPTLGTSLLYMREMENENVLIKIESNFNNSGKLTRYHLKNYGYELKESKISQDQALKLANEFINEYNHEKIEVVKVPDLYPSLYEKDKHETYGDKDGNCIVVIDLEHGIVEYFNKESTSL